MEGGNKHEDMYDEFGNYIGPDLNVDEEDDRSSDSERGGGARSSDSEDERSRPGGVVSY
jgi:hypothetical protein